MNGFRKVAVAAAIISGVSFLAFSPANAQAAERMQGGGCRSHDLNIDILGEVNVLGGFAGNLLNGEGSPGAQFTDLGSDCDHGR
jgi:hypothetical protein